MANPGLKVEIPDADAARSKLNTSPHKSFMFALEKSSGGVKDAEVDGIRAKAFQRLNEDLYTCLKVERSASATDIKKAYRKLSLLYHPDKTRIMESAELFQVIKKAFDVLSDETARASYDHRTKHRDFSTTDTTSKENTPPGSKPGSKPGSPRPWARPAARPSSPRPQTTPRPPSPRPPSASSQSSAKPPPAKAAPDKQPSSHRPSAPMNVRASSLEATAVTLQWSVREGKDKATWSDQGLTFELQTRLIEEVAWPTSAAGITAAACRKKNLKPGTAYSFRVRGVSGSGVAGPWSAALRVDTPGRKQDKGHYTGPPPPPPASSSGAPDFDGGFGDGAERRLDPVNGYPYTFEEFRAYYGSSDEWNAAKKSAPAAKPFFRPEVKQREPAPPRPPQPGPPPKAAWACPVCRRPNAAGALRCNVCGTEKNYKNSKINNIKETKEAEAAREKEKERLRERIRESQKAAERDAAERAAASRSPRASPRPPPRP
eukprot:CAMPEP_0172607306 /NCGR_PEP_ID=MMETSP1068-20121228/27507_1 /TAXON_ID=35684 /ORGANISM="Pseudopedinella elastica, Strain CCMP716" /LENGTH=487 /DNA_ID=CAMNT_0013410275 /DNA_START=66 /DNA_END=1526 /DNA_ORIENTATION=+